MELFFHEALWKSAHDMAEQFISAALQPASWPPRPGLFAREDMAVIQELGRFRIPALLGRTPKPP